MNKRTVIERFTSRPFLLTVVGAVAAIVGAYFDIDTEKIALIVGAVAPFIFGESYRDGKAAEAAAIFERQHEMIQHLGRQQVATPPSTPQPPPQSTADSLKDWGRDELERRVQEELSRRLGGGVVHGFAEPLPPSGFGPDGIEGDNDFGFRDPVPPGKPLESE